MRLSALLCAALLLIAASANANNIPRGAPVFSNANCAQGLVCPSDVDYSSDSGYMSRLVATANNCVARNFAIKDNTSLIEDAYGLDGDNCLSTKSIAKEKVGLTMTPRCCVVPDGSGKCQINCTLYGVR